MAFFLWVALTSLLLAPALSTRHNAFVLRKALSRTRDLTGEGGEIGMPPTGGVNHHRKSKRLPAAEDGAFLQRSSRHGTRHALFRRQRQDSEEPEDDQRNHLQSSAEEEHLAEEPKDNADDNAQDATGTNNEGSADPASENLENNQDEQDDADTNKEGSADAGSENLQSKQDEKAKLVELSHGRKRSASKSRRAAAMDQDEGADGDDLEVSQRNGNLEDDVGAGQEARAEAEKEFADAISDSRGEKATFRSRKAAGNDLNTESEDVGADTAEDPESGKDQAESGSNGNGDAAQSRTKTQSEEGQSGESQEAQDNDHDNRQEGGGNASLAQKSHRSRSGHSHRATRKGGDKSNDDIPAGDDQSGHGDDTPGGNGGREDPPNSEPAGHDQGNSANQQFSDKTSDQTNENSAKMLKLVSELQNILQDRLQDGEGSTRKDAAALDDDEPSVPLSSRKIHGAHLRPGQLLQGSSSTRAAHTVKAHTHRPAVMAERAVHDPVSLHQRRMSPDMDEDGNLIPRRSHHGADYPR